MLRQRWRRAGFQHLSRVDLWNFSFASFFFFFLRSVREKLDGQGVSNFFSEIDLWNFFFSLGYAKKLDGADVGEGRKKSVCSRPFSG